MNEAFSAVLYQTFGYSIATIIGIGVIAILQRGFFFKWLKVRASLGRLILVRIRAINRWYYEVGSIEENDLVFGKKADRKRISNVFDDYFYRSMGMSWINLDGSKWCVLMPNSTSAIEGFDPEKQESLVTRALYKPQIADRKEQIIMMMIAFALLAALISAYFGYNTLNKVGMLKATIDGLKNGLAVATG